MTDSHRTVDSGRQLGRLTYQECLQRLASEQLGRLAVMVAHYPQVFLLNYRLDDTVVVFRTHSGTKLLAAEHANVGFQVDHIDATTRTGWSVLVQGTAEDVTDRVGDAVTQRSQQLNINPWVADDSSRVVRIIPARVDGVALTPGETAFWSDNRAYL